VAARDGSESRVRCLLNKLDAHAWYQDEDGMTALHHACNSGPDDTEKIKLLLDEGGADIDAVNNAGESPLRLAINRKGASGATARYLRDSGGKDLGPKPRQTSPVRRADPYATHESSQSPPVWQGVELMYEDINPLTGRRSSSPWDSRATWHPYPLRIPSTISHPRYCLPPIEALRTRSPSPM
jgi:hypothetical protein